MKLSSGMKSESGPKDSMAPMHHPDMDVRLPSFVSTKLTNELKAKVDLLLVTVTAIEWKAVLRKMEPPAGASKLLKVHHDKAGYMVGMFGVYCVALLQSDKFSQASQSVVSAALKCWDTKATILVGTGLGLRQDHQLGDVMISHRLATYDPERMVSATQSHSLGLVIEGGQNLSPLFTKEPETHNWKFANSVKRCGLILSGSKVVESSVLTAELKRKYPEAIGVETEGDGLYRACYDFGQQWIIVRGICGFAGVTNEYKEDVMKFAAAAATSLAHHVFSSNNLESIGCTAKVYGNECADSWTPKGFPVFISYDTGFYKKQGEIVDGLQRCLTTRGVQVYASNDIVTKSFATAKVDGAVLVALVDHKLYLQSLTCMEELRRALDSTEVQVLPILLSPIDDYPSSALDVRKLLGESWNADWSSKWTPQEYLRVIRVTESLAQSSRRRVYEDPSFGFTVIVDDVVSILKENQEPGDFLDQAPQAVPPSFWRLLNPIKDCFPAKISDTTVDIHQVGYEKIVQFLAASEDSTSVSIAGLKAAGGVGKTVLALRIANCKTVKDYFASEGVLWAEFGEGDSTAKPALRRIYSDLGGEGELCLSEDDSSGQLLSARESFEELLRRRQPTALLVLDDIWDKKHLEVFKQVIVDTKIKILVTTRFKGLAEEVFGQGNSVIDLGTNLSEADALVLMIRYAGLSSVLEEDRSTMNKLAGHFGYHAKALAIVSARFKRFKSWDNLLASVERGKLNLNGAPEAKQWVYAAVNHTLAPALTDSPDLKEFFLQLGVLVEGARFSLSDLCLLWNCEIFDTTAVADTLFECSVIEQEGPPEYDGHAVYYMHDLVRDCARQDPGTKEREQRFIRRLISIFQNEQHHATGYIFMHLLKHDLPDAARVGAEASQVYARAQEGLFEEHWSNNEFILLAACKSPGEKGEKALSSAGVQLCKEKGFFERALQLQDDHNLYGSKWMIDSEAFLMFTNALKKTCQLRGISFNGNGIGCDGVTEVINALKERSTSCLQALRLYNNRIGAAGAKSLGQWLEVDNVLGELDLGKNAIGDLGAKAIGGALARNKTLEQLYLRDNGMGDSGALSLALGLRNNNRLWILELTGNNFGTPGRCVLEDAFQANRTLKTLYFEERYPHLLRKFGIGRLAYTANDLPGGSSIHGTFDLEHERNSRNPIAYWIGDRSHCL